MHGVSKWFMVFTWHYYQSSLFSKYDVQPIMKCLWSIVVSVCGYLYGCIIVGFHWNFSLWVQFHLNVHTDVHNLCLLQTLTLLIVHSFSVPSLAINGKGVRRTPKGTPTVVRRGQTDWLHRLLCGNPGVHRKLASEPNRTRLKYSGLNRIWTGSEPDTAPSPVLVRF